MKINQTSAANTVSKENMQAQETEKKEVVSKGVGGGADSFQNSPTSGLPNRNDTIGGGHQTKEIPKETTAKSPDEKKTEQQPETPAWLKGKEHGGGIGWSKDVRPVNHSVSETAKVNNPLDNKEQKVGLDYFNTQNRLKEKIVADENSVKNFDTGSGQSTGNTSNVPGRKNPFGGHGGVPKGYGKNESSKQEQTSMFSNTQLLLKDAVTKPTSTSSDPAPIPYPKTETSGDTSSKVQIESKVSEVGYKSSTGDEPGVLKGMISHTNMDKSMYSIKNPTSSVDLSFLAKGKITPTPDSVDDSHAPEAIKGEAPVRTDRATNKDQVTLHDENKRQQEVVHVERQEIFGSMIGRKTDGRSTPTPSDGTTDPQGPPPDTGTGAVDLPTLHPKGDPPDGDEA